MKGHSTLIRYPELKPHHQMQSNVILRTPIFWGGDGSYSSAELVWFLYLMAYQLLWVFQYHSYSNRRMRVILFNPQLG